MNYRSLNNKLLIKLLDFYKVLDNRLEGSGIKPILYGSLSYAYFTNDENIEINDIDLIAPESIFLGIIELMKDEKVVNCQLTNHNSLRLLKDGAKLSIHSQEKALEVFDFTKNLVELDINGISFLSLDLDTLIKFYKKGTDYLQPKKVGYKEKLNKLLETKYKNNHTFFIFKPSILERKNNQGKPLYLDIENYIIENGFKIVSKKEVKLSIEDIEYIYREEYNNLIPILGEESVKKAMEVNKKLYSNKTVVMALAEKNNAIKVADLLKGDNYWPAKCNANSIRYMFRDKQFDNFEMPKGKIIDVPCDNIVHCPKSISEFNGVISRWLI